ncbi:pre-mRNA-splicing factor SLU7 [Artemisia annua]|uniref:Pre-mRNA-splicing factor SLU7 n=1 Tax=Artemisia annua TaxID=35608 RepID=A0A2U1LF61_ARTAN|nr:pre-mRNA-splicing factor SLU7 [Artemisia annua]
MATASVAFKSREDHRKQMELEEARKAGLAPAEVDEDGKEINPHIPQYMSSAPWYLNAERPSLKHQRKWKSDPNYTKSWYDRGAKIYQADKYRKGACVNCGAMTHTRETCMERPRKLGAKWTSKNIAPDEKIETFELDYDGKRDRWNGYDAASFELKNGIIRISTVESVAGDCRYVWHVAILVEFLSSIRLTHFLLSSFLFVRLTRQISHAVHSGTDLESAIQNCMSYKSEGQGFMVEVNVNPVYGLASGFPELLQFVLEHVEDKNVETLLEFHCDDCGICRVGGRENTQESCTDDSGSLVVYSVVDVKAVKLTCELLSIYCGELCGVGDGDSVCDCVDEDGVEE